MAGGTRDHVLVPLWDDADGDAVPGLQGSGGALFLDRHRSGVRQEIPELHRLTGPDLAYLVETDRRIPDAFRLVGHSVMASGAPL